MNKTALFILLAAVIVLTGCTNVRTVGNVNGLTVTRVTTRGVFSPATTTVLLSDSNAPGTIEAIVANASGQGFLPAVANAAGAAGAAALIRPDRTRVNNTTSAAGGLANSGSVASSTATSVTSSSANGNTGNSITRDNGSNHHNQ